VIWVKSLKKAICYEVGELGLSYFL